MLCDGVAACHRYAACVLCAVLSTTESQHVIGMVCVLFAVLSATLSYSTQRTVHTTHYTHHTYDMLPHHLITYNDVDFYRILT